MDNGVNVEDNKILNMGATGNINAARITALQERKKQIEDNLAKRNQELRQLCIQEAELTGITPPEMPLEPGETFPLIRRRVGTAFQLPENLIKNANNKDELIANLELQIQLHANMAEAALGLANEQNMSKTMKRQHRSEYQKHKSQCIALQEKLTLVKERVASEQHKQKKKPRVLEQVDDNISVTTNMNDSFAKSDLRHSMRSAKHSISSSNESCVDQRFTQGISRRPYRNTEMFYLDNPSVKQEELLNSGFYRLNLNGYNKYMERHETINNEHTNQNLVPNYNSHSSNSLQYNLTHNSHIFNQHVYQPSPYYQQSNSNVPQHNTHVTQHSPHNPHVPQHNSHVAQHISQHSPHSPHNPQHSPQIISPRSVQQLHNYVSQYPTDLSKIHLGSNHVNPHFSNTHLIGQSSPPSVLQKSRYFPSHTIHGQSAYRQYANESVYRNPHQIQPHQQYEQMNMLTSGLGGCWKKSENGELIWCTSDTNWQREKRFGSLDRRKNKRVPKRLSPSVDSKSATIGCVSNYPDQFRNASVKQIITRRVQDNGQLVRTQSLGSVGVQTVDSVYPSDDNSSCESDSHSINNVNQSLRKHKEKEWLETSLDSPVSPAQSTVSNSQPPVPSVLAPEEKYVICSPPPHIPPPITPKPVLEIPAESNPSPRIPDTNIELFNNNIPKNCTIVQAGQCKPYHEETKPFEMSDFYKYSTKFKKSPIKENENLNKTSLKQANINIHRNLNESFEECSKNSYQQPMKCHPYNNSTSNMNVMDNIGSLNTSLELNHMMVSDNFSAEMNAWYKDQQKANNDGNTQQSRSAATLV